MRFGSASIIGVLVLIGGTLAPCARSQTSKPASALSDDELIDRLRFVNEDHYSVRTNIIAASGPLPQGQRLMQEPGPEPSAVMDEIRNRGPKCLAALCAHLSDKRKTRAAIGRPTIFSAKYDWNPHTQKRQPGVVSKVDWFDDGEQKVPNRNSDAYNITVGDLCFELLGQIVNRDFRASWYQPSGIIFINSPVLTPALASAVRNAWATRTPQQLRESLIHDVELPDRDGRAEGGIQTLSTYFPDAVAGAVRSRLKLTTYDYWVVKAFADDLLYDPDDASRSAKIAKFVKTNPIGYREALLHYLWPERSLKSAYAAEIPHAVLLQQIGGSIDEDHPPLPAAIDMMSNCSFIEALQGITSSEVDDAVYSEYLIRSKDADEKMTSNDYIAVACLKRIAHKQHDAELLDYARRRLGVVTDKWDKSRMQTAVDALAAQPRK